MREQYSTPLTLTATHTKPLAAKSCTNRLLNIQKYLLTPSALFRNFGGSIMFVYTIGGILTSDTKQWSIQAKLITLGLSSLWGLIASKPVFDYLNHNHTLSAAQLLQSHQHTLTIRNQQVTQTELTTTAKLAISLFSALFYGASAGLLTESSPTALGTMATSLIVAGMLSHTKTRNTGKLSITFLFASMTAAVIADLSKIAVNSLHEVFSDQPMPAEIKAIRTIIMIGTFFSFTLALMKSIKQNMGKFTEVKNQNKQRPWQQKELDLLFRAYTSQPGADRALSHPTIEAAIIDLRQRVLTDNGSTQAQQYSVAHQYTLPMAVYVLNAGVVAAAMFLFFKSGQNIGRDFIGLPNERSIITFAGFSCLALFSMASYLSSEIISQYVTRKHMPRTVANIQPEGTAPLPTEIPNDIPGAMLRKALTMASISTAPPVFFLLNAMGNKTSPIVIGSLLVCLLWAQISGKVSSNILPQLHNSHVRTAKDIYIEGLLDIYHQQGGKRDTPFNGITSVELAANIRHAIDPATQPAPGAAAPHVDAAADESLPTNPGLNII
ncbi:MAG: hypothetical protein P1U34_06310 [Coxiellaceae bacterium]|nr:hypothetical protein [Coxiellaceae bacterium]